MRGGGAGGSRDGSGALWFASLGTARFASWCASLPAGGRDAVTMPPVDEPWDFTRRRLLALAPPLTGVAMTVTKARAAASPASAGIVSAAQFGLVGDGLADDGPAIRAALAAGLVVELPPGKFRIGAPLVLSDGQLIRGAGRAGWEPYRGAGPPASAVKTEIIVDGHLAIDARGTNSASVQGLAIRALAARQSDWGRPAGYQLGAIGIDIAESWQFEATDISFHGLQIGIANIADHGRTTQMPRIGEWSAHDCETVIRFVSHDPSFYAVRDARIDGCIAAVHCERIVEVKNCDGLRIENVRFFQCENNSIYIEGTPFISIIGVTLFETGAEALVLKKCVYTVLSGMLVARTGYYRRGSLIQKTAILIEDCTDLSFQGVVEQPVGRAFTIRSSINVSITASVGTPFWSTGSLAAGEGAIHVERSHAVLINCAFSGSAYWVAVWSDAASAASIDGRITTEGSAGTVRCVQLQRPPFGHVVRTSAAMTIGPRRWQPLDTLRLLVPGGKSLVTRSVELTAPGVIFATETDHWGTALTEPGGGSLSLERKLLHRNATPTDRYASITVGVFNPNGDPVLLAAGHEARVSLAVE